MRRNARAAIHGLQPIHHPGQIFSDGPITARQLAQRPQSIFSVVDRSQPYAAQRIGQLARLHLVVLAPLLESGIAPRIADQNFLYLRRQQIVQPGRPGSFFPGHMQLAPQTVEKPQNSAGSGFADGFHDQLATAIEDGDRARAAGIA
jgi:hypothetical protein